MSLPTPARALAALGAAGALACACLVTAPAAWAHDSLRSSTPGDGTTVANAPESISLGFSEAPLQLGAQVVVTGPDGAAVTQGSPQVAGNDVVQGLAPDRPAGTYTVDWRVTSSDGHPIEGALAFTAEAAVGATPPPSASTPASAAPSTSSAAPSTGEVTASPSAAPASAGADAGSGISGSTWAWTIAAGAAGALMGALLVRARRRSPRA